jgi:hypothetical protein
MARADTAFHSSPGSQPRNVVMINFFDVLYWMGMLCLVPIIGAVIRDARRQAASSPETQRGAPAMRAEAAPLA